MEVVVGDVYRFKVLMNSGGWVSGGGYFQGVGGCMLKCLFWEFVDIY